MIIKTFELKFKLLFRKLTFKIWINIIKEMRLTNTMIKYIIIYLQINKIIFWTFKWNSKTKLFKEKQFKDSLLINIEYYYNVYFFKQNILVENGFEI